MVPGTWVSFSTAKPEDWAAAKATLVPGSAVATPYEAKMAADGFAGCACTP